MQKKPHKKPIFQIEFGLFSFLAYDLIALGFRPCLAGTTDSVLQKGCYQFQQEHIPSSSK